MPLNMTRPYRHPKTGVYWIRKAVPAALRPLVGKRELKRSLQTKDPHEAKRLAPAALTEFDAIIGAARLGQRCTSDDLEALAGVHFRKRLDQLLDQARREAWDDSSFEGTEASHEAVLDALLGQVLDTQRVDGDDPAEEAAVIGWAQPKMAALMQEHRFPLRPELQRQLAILLYRAEGQAITAARARYQCWEHDPAPEFPRMRPAEARSLPALFQAYADHREIRSSTRKDWGAVIDHFHAFVDRKAPDRITKEDVRRYANHLREKGGITGKPLSASRLNQAYLASIRAVFSWAVDQDHLQHNPATKVTIEARADSERPAKRGYTNEELVAILRASREQTIPFRRWVPWLCTFTGARISEILNLHKRHVGKTEGIWYLQIRADTRRAADGTAHRSRLKTAGSARCVPVHPALIAEGFLDYLDSVSDDDYVFPGNWSDQHGNRTKGPANQLRRWIRSVVEVTDELSPTHSFRHWLTSKARRVKMDPDVRRQITGHKFTDVHGRYGPADIPFLAEALGEIESPIPPPASPD